MKYNIRERKICFQRFHTIEEVQVTHETFAGTMSPELTRLIVRSRGAAAVVLLHPVRRSVYLVEQFRLATADRDSGWIREIVAGLIDPGEEPGQTARREAEEEAGFPLRELHHIVDFYSTPGGCDEKIYLYLAIIDPDLPVEITNGVDDEDLRLVEIPLAELAECIDKGQIIDGKSLVGLQWLLRHLTDYLPEE